MADMEDHDLLVRIDERVSAGFKQVDDRFKDNEKALVTARNAASDAIDAALKRINEELLHINKLREEVIEDRAIFVSKETYKPVADMVAAHEVYKNRAAGLAIILTLVSGSIGAMIARVFGG